MLKNKHVAWFITAAAVITLIQAIGGGSKEAAYWSFGAAWFAWRLALEANDE
jgi:hypothetical protein